MRPGIKQTGAAISDRAAGFYRLTAPFETLMTQL
jgi:hypothetical protein